MRHIRKVTLLTLLSLTIASSPTYGMSYLSGAWNAAKNLSPIASAGSLLSKIPGVQSVVSSASRVLNGTSGALSTYARNEAGLLEQSNLLVNLTPAVLYGLRNPLCKMLSCLTMNRLSPELFNKLLIATTTPITLVIHAYCLHILLTNALLNPWNLWNIWHMVRNADQLFCEAATLLNFNVIQFPDELTRGQINTITIHGIMSLMCYENPAPSMIMIIRCFSYLITRRYYMGLGIRSGYQEIKTKMNANVRKLYRFFNPPIRHDRAIADLGGRTTCAICFEDFASGEHGSSFACNHHYHTECIDSWLDRTQKCPMCQSPVNKDTTTYVTFK